MGKYDQKITFLKEGQTSDGYGGYIPTETEVLTTWAAVEQLKRSKQLEQAQETIKSVWRMTIQSRASFTLDEKYIVKWRGTKYKIITGGQTDNVRLDQQTTFDVCQL